MHTLAHDDLTTTADAGPAVPPAEYAPEAMTEALTADEMRRLIFEATRLKNRRVRCVLLELHGGGVNIVALNRAA